MNNSLIHPPNSNCTIEVSLIGTGGGYGESVVIHLGNDNWVVVDSCIDPLSKMSLPLQYLKLLGVNLSLDVKAIICTHWHDDHIQGISQLVEECKNADFCMAKTTDLKKFLLLVGLDYNKAKSDPSISSTIELSKCLNIIKNRKNVNVKSAVQDRILYNFSSENIKSKIISLSPSDFVVDEFNKEVSVLMKDYYNDDRKIVAQSPNNKSVALYIEVNNHRVLLGSDLEVSNDKRKGWLCIIEKSQSINLKSSLFKIPHHGSENGYHKKIWDELLIKNPIAKLTPFNRGRKLPTKKMLNRYLTLTSELYVATHKTTKSPKKREKSITKIIWRHNNSLREVKYSFGIVRSRLDLCKDNSCWDVECFNDAVKINESVLKKEKVL